MRLYCGFLACALFGAGIPDLLPVDTSGYLPVIRAQIEKVTAATKERPHDAGAAGMLAMTLHAYSQYDAAVAAYSRALFLQPRNFDWVYLLGAVEITQGRFDAAVELFRTAVQIRPDDLAAELRLADCLLALARPQDAGKHYRRILEAHADTPQAWYGLGRVLETERDHTAAVQSYSKACELFPAFGAAHFALARELRLLGNKAGMAQHLSAYSKNVTVEPPLDDPLFKRIRELNMGVQAHLQRAAELEKAALLEDAVRENEAALVVDPRNVQAHVNLISLRARLGDSTKARQHFDTAIALDPGRSDAWYNDGVLLLREKEFGRAENAFRKALDINPDYAEAHNNLGAIYEQQGRLDDAAAEFRKAIAERPDYALARFHLGRILVNREKYDEAIRQLLRALSPEDDQTTVYLYALAATYARAGDRAHALDYFQKAHDAAVARSQSQLRISIEADMKALQNER